MAGNHDRDWVRSIGQADCTGRVWVADAFGERAIRNRFAVGDLAEFIPDLLLKGCAFGRKWEIEGFQFSGKVGSKLSG